MPKFDHQRLDAFSVARDALTGGDAIARRIPPAVALPWLTNSDVRCCPASSASQKRPAVLEATDSPAFAARDGEHRKPRPLQLLRLAPRDEAEHLLSLLDRLCAMLTRLAGLSHRPAETRD